MGIRGLNKIIKRVAPHVIKEKSIHGYKYSKIAIDSSILMYKYRYASKESEDSHIHGFFQRVCFYLKRGIMPIFVFDGAPPDAKNAILTKRVRQKTKIEEKIQLLTAKLEENEETIQIEEEIVKLSKQVTYVTRTHRQECKYLLRLLGIPVIEANGEAEATCVALQKKKDVEYTFTEDTDALTFGSPVVLRSARKLEKVIEVNLDELLTGLKLTMNQFIDFCILCGCDYCPTIPKIGPVTSLNLIQEHENIENIINTLPSKYNIPENFDYGTARQLFKQDIVLPEYDLSIKPIQYTKLELFLTTEKNINQTVFENIIKRYTYALGEYNSIISKENNKKKIVESNKITQYFTFPMVKCTKEKIKCECTIKSECKCIITISQNRNQHRQTSLV